MHKKRKTYTPTCVSAQNLRVKEKLKITKIAKIFACGALKNAHKTQNLHAYVCKCAKPTRQRRVLLFFEHFFVKIFVFKNNFGLFFPKRAKARRVV